MITIGIHGNCILERNCLYLDKLLLNIEIYPGVRNEGRLSTKYLDCSHKLISLITVSHNESHWMMSKKIFWVLY